MCAVEYTTPWEWSVHRVSHTGWVTGHLEARFLKPQALTMSRPGGHMVRVTCR